MEKEGHFAAEWWGHLRAELGGHYPRIIQSEIPSYEWKEQFIEYAKSDNPLKQNDIESLSKLLFSEINV